MPILPMFGPRRCLRCRGSGKCAKSQSARRETGRLAKPVHHLGRCAGLKEKFDGGTVPSSAESGVKSVSGNCGKCGNSLQSSQRETGALAKPVYDLDRAKRGVALHNSRRNLVRRGNIKIDD